MICKVTQADILNLSGRIIAGIVSNPASGIMLHDQYARQALIQQTVQDVQNAFMSSGIDIIEMADEIPEHL